MAIYETHAHETTNTSVPFLNYGYVPLSASETSLAAIREPEPFLFSAYLYLHVASQAYLEGRKVLEVGSGRGGGCQFIRKYLQAGHVVGLDLTEANVLLSRSENLDTAISFEVGNAESLPFPSESFDEVVNIESSHHYRNMNAFMCETQRVLRKGGHLLYADIFHGDESTLYNSGTTMQRVLEHGSLRLMRCKDITQNVVASLEARARSTKELLHQMGLSQKQIQTWSEWARLPDTAGYRRLVDRRDVYKSCLFEKE